MALDKVALKTALEGPDYDTDVVGGAHGALMVALHKPDAALPKRYHSISIADFQGAVAVEYASLSDALRQQIDGYLASQAGNVPVQKPGVQAWINANLPNSKAAIIALAQQDGRPIDAFLTDVDDTSASKADVVEACRQITKAFAHPTQIAAKDAIKQIRRDKAQARKDAINTAWDGTIRQSVKDGWGKNFPIGPDGDMDRLRAWERAEKLFLFREDIATNPL